MNKKDQKLQELAAKLQKTRNGVYFAMTFIDAWLEANKEREQEEGGDLYFNSIRDCLVDLDNVREYLDQKVDSIKKKLRNNFIKDMLKEEGKHETNE